jgi:hypothetical protein
MRNAYKILPAIPDERRPLERTRYRWMYTIIKDLKRKRA